MQKKVIALGLLIGAMVGSDVVAGRGKKAKGRQEGREDTLRSRKDKKAWDKKAALKAAEKKDRQKRSLEKSSKFFLHNS